MHISAHLLVQLLVLQSQQAYFVHRARLLVLRAPSGRRRDLHDRRNHHDQDRGHLLQVLLARIRLLQAHRQGVPEIHQVHGLANYSFHLKKHVRWLVPQCLETHLHSDQNLQRALCQERLGLRPEVARSNLGTAERVRFQLVPKTPNRISRCFYGV